MSFFDKIREFFKDITDHADYVEATVVSGDSVWHIVKQASDDDETDAVIAGRVAEVRELNGLDEEAVIHPGQKLKLPKHW